MIESGQLGEPVPGAAVEWREACILPLHPSQLSLPRGGAGASTHGALWCEVGCLGTSETDAGKPTSVNLWNSS